MLKKLKVEYYYILADSCLSIATSYNKCASKLCKKGLSCKNKGYTEEANYYYKSAADCVNKRDEYDRKSQNYYNKFLASREVLKDV